MGKSRKREYFDGLTKNSDDRRYENRAKRREFKQAVRDGAFDTMHFSKKEKFKDTYEEFDD